MEQPIREAVEKLPKWKLKNNPSDRPHSSSVLMMLGRNAVIVGDSSDLLFDSMVLECDSLAEFEVRLKDVRYEVKFKLREGCASTAATAIANALATLVDKAGSINRETRIWEADEFNPDEFIKNNLINLPEAWNG